MIKKEKVLTITLTASVICLAFLSYINLAKAADCGGAVVCACGDTVIASTTLASDLGSEARPCDGHGLVIGANNITIDGGGHSLIGSGGVKSAGISVGGYNNVTVKNFSDITNFEDGVYLSSSRNSTIEAVTISSSTNGIKLFSADHNNISNNNVGNNNKGIFLEESDYNDLLDNIADSNLYGIYLATANSNNLTGNSVNANTIDGIYLNYSADNTLTYNETSNNNNNGFYLFSSDLNIINNNTSTVNKRGFYILSSDGNFFTSNYAGINNEKGFYISDSTANELTNNVAAENVVNLIVDATQNAYWDNEISTTNTVEGKPVFYLYNVRGDENNHIIYSGNSEDVGLGYEYVGDIGMFWCIDCAYIEVKDAFLSANNASGVYFNQTDSSIIHNITSSEGDIGFNIINSTENEVTNNIVSNNFGVGIRMAASPNNTFSNNTVSGNGMDGFNINISSNNTFSFNTAVGNVNGFSVNFSPSYFYNNTVLSNRQSGILLSNSSLSTLYNNTVRSNNIGMFMYNSSGNEINNNIFEANILGIQFASDADNNTIISNSLVGNVTDIQDDGRDNIYLSNSVRHNLISQMISFTEDIRVRNLQEQISLDVAMLDMNGEDCPTCTYTTSASPNESVAVSENGNELTISFIPNRSGAYSLLLRVTDLDDNITERGFRYLIDDMNEQTSTYYLRGALPTHGQPAGSDAKSLLLTAPTSTEAWSCAVWVQNSPDQMPNYPLANLSRINIHSWYKQNSDDTGYIGAERYLSYGSDVNALSAIPKTAEYSWVNSDFSELNWAMEYLNSWHVIAIKLHGSDPVWTTFPEGEINKSYADFTYEYTTTPAIRTISNYNINILSATAPADATSSAQIVLENLLAEATSTIITLDDFKRPFLNAISTIYSDATTTLAINLDSEASSTLDAVPLDITPSSGSVTININTWNTNGNYYKKWTEEGSSHDIVTTHTIGDLKPNTIYNIKIDGLLYHAYTSNSLGEISFTYNDGYSVKTFEVEERAPDGSGPPVSPPATGGGSYTVTIPMDKTQDLGLVETTGVNTLSYIGSISSFSALVGRTYTIEKHKIKIIGLDLINKTITLQVESEPQILNIKLTELAKVDLDNDKLPDISIQFSSLYVNRAELTIKSLLNQTIVTATPGIKPVISTPASAIKTKYNFKRNLSLGMKSSDIKELQKYLNANGYTISKSGPGSSGKETTFFGPATRSALIKFQKAKKINPANGLFGPKTRGAVNK